MAQTVSMRVGAATRERHRTTLSAGLAHASEDRTLNARLGSLTDLNFCRDSSLLARVIRFKRADGEGRL